jgi:hypothetical protein
MTARAERAAVDAATWYVTLGWTTGVLFTIMLAFTLVTLASSRGAPTIGNYALVVGGILLSAALTFGVYRRSTVAATGLFATWAAGWVYNGVINGKILPPFGIVGVLVGIGLVLGVWGTLSLRELVEPRAPAA